MKTASLCAGLAFSLLVGCGSNAARAAGGGVDAIKDYLVQQVTKMDAASHDYLANAEAYQRIIDANGGDYNKAATNNGPELLALVAKMQDDYKGLHMARLRDG